MTNKQIRLTLFWVTLIAWALIVFTSCTKNYKCSRYSALEVFYNPKEQSCYYRANGNRVYLKKEQCANLCYED